MRNSKLMLFGAAMFATLSLAAASVRAQDHDDRRSVQEHRVYDPVHKDYHSWNGDEGTGNGGTITKTIADTCGSQTTADHQLGGPLSFR